jgi:hypothetical protein
MGIMPTLRKPKDAAAPLTFDQELEQRLNALATAEADLHSDQRRRGAVHQKFTDAKEARLAAQRRYDAAVPGRDDVSALWATVEAAQAVEADERASVIAIEATPSPAPAFAELCAATYEWLRPVATDAMRQHHINVAKALRWGWEPGDQAVSAYVALRGAENFREHIEDVCRRWGWRMFSPVLGFVRPVPSVYSALCTEGNMAAFPQYEREMRDAGMFPGPVSR